MKKALLISDDLPEAESQENVQKIPCQSGHVDPERGGRSKSSGLTPQKHIKEQFIKKRGATDDDGDMILNAEDSAKLREAYKQKVQDLRNDFEKRLDAYLKKYGLSKIRRWTYCADD